MELIGIATVPSRRESATQVQVYCETADVVTIEQALTNLYVYRSPRVEAVFIR